MARTPRPDARGAPREAVELRVHGVGGAPPEEILDVPVTRLVAGRESAGFFRPYLPEDPPREAYSWGGLTSASRLRALWVLLAPFALANLAGWMLRHGGDPTDRTGRRRRPSESFVAGLVRSFGLVITVALASYLAIGTVDLVGFQCGSDRSCVGGRWWLSPWDNRLVGGDPARAMAVGAAVATIAVLGVAWLARRSQTAIHPRTSFTPVDDPALTLGLTRRRLWEAPHVAHRLGLAHTAAALATVGLTLAVALPPVGGFSSLAAPVGWALVGVCLLAVARLEGVSSRLHVGLLGGAALYTAGLMAWLFLDPSAAPVAGPLPATVPAVLFPVYALASLLVLAGAYWLWRRNRRGPLRPALLAPGLLLVAAGAVNAFGSGLLIRLADLLGSPRSASEQAAGAPTSPPVAYPDWVADIAVVTVFGLFVSAVAGAVVWLRAGTGPTCDQLAVRYAARGGLDCTDPHDREWAEGVARAEAVAGVTDRIGPGVAATIGVVLVALAAAVVASDDPSGLGLGSWADPLAAPASVVLGVVPVVAVVVISRLYRSRSVRRIVGTVWDVVTFWPRWYHPWSPPSYGERAVPQLGSRLRTLAEGGVVVSAHSQGSVLAVATLAWLEGGVVDDMAVLTHGSPLTRLYARYFPEHFAPELYAELAARVRGWVNLWRPTDFIGGPLAAAGVEDRMVFDPPSSRPDAPGEPRPEPLRHSHYDRTEEYGEAVADLMKAVGSG